MNAQRYRAARDLLLQYSHDTAAAHREFAWPEVDDRFNWAHDWFDSIAAGNDKIALRIVEDDDSEAAYSFDELRRRSNQVANWLRSLGVEPGDSVMLMLANRVELWESMLAVMKIGAVTLPTAIVLGAEELDDRVRRGGVRWVITDEADAEKFDWFTGEFSVIAVGGARGAERMAIGLNNEFDLNRPRIPYANSYQASEAPVPATRGGDDPAIAYFTSGTTSKPKIVIHSHRSYPVGHLSTMYWLGVRPGDTHMVISSPGWGKHAWSAFFAPWIAEACVFVDNYAKFNPQRLIDRLDSAGVTTFCAPPTVWRMLIKHAPTQRPGQLREVLSAGEPLNPEVIDRIHDWWGLKIRDGYGQTELTASIANAPGDEVVAGSMGRALPGLKVVLVDQNTGERIPDDLPRAEGEVCIDLTAPRPVSIMTGYADNPAATAERFDGGVFHTGDVAQRDPSGRLTFVGRVDDVFKASDYKVSPFEVESALVEHPAVAEAAVVGAPDETRLNITKAYVQLADGYQPDEQTAFAILLHARRTLPPYMRVRRLEFRELPKTISGKIRRVELRDREQQFARRGERLPLEFREEDFPDLKKHR